MVANGNNNWKPQILEDICAQITDGKHGDCEDQPDSGFYFLSCKDVANGKLNFEGARQITEADFLDTHRRTKFAPSDILITNSGTIGRMAIAPDNELTRRTTFQKSVAILKPNASRVEPNFLYYAIQADIHRLIEFAGGTAQKNLLLRDLRTFEVSVPPIPIQRRIAGFLSVYDELIENSQRRIKILEAIARALYRDALGAGTQSAASRPVVDSPYWRFISENVGNYAGTKRYYATADIDGLAVTRPGIDYRFAEKPSRAQKQPIPNSVWFARMKDTHKIAWYGPINDERVSGVILSSGFAGFEARDAELWPLLFLTISSEQFHVQKDLYCTGATQMSLTNESLARIMMPLLDEETARQLGRSAGPMLNAIAGLQWRNENLRRTRALLLPRLLSGQIDVEALAS
jgi:hypothetical protein